MKRRLLTDNQEKLAYRLICLRRRYKIIDKNGPLLGDLGFEECQSLLNKLHEDIKQTFEHMVEEYEI
jgi:hypothetical protein